MAKVAGPSSGALFLGTLSAQARSYLLRLFRGAVGEGYRRFVEPACGAFAMSHLAVQAGFRPGQVEASDISLFSAVMGYGLTGRRVDGLGIVVNQAGLDDIDTGDPASVLWLIGYLRLVGQSRNPLAEMIARETLLGKEQQIKALAEQLTRGHQIMAGMHFEAEDLFQHLERVWDDPQAIVCVNPPTYTGGFERYYNTGGRLTWREPSYGVFDAEAGVEALMERAMAARALVVCYQERKLGQAIGPPIYMEDGIRRSGGLANQVNMYLCVNRPNEAMRFTGGMAMKRRVIGQVEAGDFTVLPAGYEVGDAARLEVVLIPGAQALYYRCLWTHKFAVDSGGNLGKGGAILLDGYLVGVFGYDQSFIVGWKSANLTGRLMLHYGMTVPNRGYRYGRLLTMVAMNRQTVEMMLDDYYAARVTELATVQQTARPESKEMRGLMKLEARKPHDKYGYKLVYVAKLDKLPFGSIFGRWLARERHWLANRGK